MNHYVEDHENGTLRANGTGGPPRTDKQPIVTYGLNTNRGGNADVCLEEEGAPPITSSHGNPGGVLNAQGVRRLTPVECERLQALPDGWTEHGPDSRRYAAIGDAVTSSVAEWIGRRLITA